MAFLHTSLMFKTNINSEYLGEEMINLLDKTFVIKGLFVQQLLEDILLRSVIGDKF